MMEVRMGETAVRRMTVAEFFDWQPRDDGRYELVDGVPVMMTRARRRHDRIVANALRSLGNKLDGSRCIPFTADIAVLIPNGNVRLPDVGVDCGRFVDNAMYADAPRLVIEVLSPSTRDFDMFGKLDEYKTVESLTHIVLVDPDQPRAMHWWRAEDRTWRHQAHEGLEAVIAFPDLEIAIGLGELYRGLDFTRQAT
jgi:Uma2 family endonuclease